MRLPRRTLVLILVALLVYVGGYIAFRQTQTKTWVRDYRQYVIYPRNLPGKALYYAWRPLAWADEALTGRGSHIGPHLRLEIGGPKTHT